MWGVRKGRRGKGGRRIGTTSADKVEPPYKSYIPLMGSWKCLNYNHNCYFDSEPIKSPWILIVPLSANSYPSHHVNKEKT